MVIILVTGRADFIGSHICMNLLELSYKIVSLDSYLNCSKKFFKEINKICRSKGINQNLINNFETIILLMTLHEKNLYDFLLILNLFCYPFSCNLQKCCEGINLV